MELQTDLDEERKLAKKKALVRRMEFDSVVRLQPGVINLKTR